MIKFDPNNNLWRGAAPTTPSDWKAVRDRGIVSILDLETYPMDFFGNARCRAVLDAWYSGRGVRVTPCPMGAVLPPTKARLELAMTLIGALPRPLLVHCREGVDRTGVVVAYYQNRVMGRSRDECMQGMLDAGFHRGRYFWWLPFIYAILY